MAKLNQILAIEKGIKTRVLAELAELQKATEKAALVNGFTKTYQPRDEEGEMYPPESQKVQFEHQSVFDQISAGLAELLDVTATKDWANCTAKADVVVDGRVLVANAPAPFLLFLEKQLAELTSFVHKMAELDAANDWNVDPTTGLFKTEPTATQRTKKVQRPIVLYDATEHHPAQTQLITEDVVVGQWVTVKLSGALPAPRKKVLLARIEKLAQAVKFAREQANGSDVVDQKIGAAMLDYLFAK